MSVLVPRIAASKLAELGAHLRIVMLSGPRQAGKSTLLTQYVAERGGTYRTLDSAATLQAARDDPDAFVSHGQPPLGIDEVQLGGDDLVRAIKVAVDTDPRPGRFVLSGSSRFLTIPKLSESLAGRIAFIELWPLSMPERTGGDADVLDRLFDEPTTLIHDSAWQREQYLACVSASGYPEVLSIPSPVARRAWYDGYLGTVINRDIRDFATVVRADAMFTLLSLVAARTGQLAVLSDLADGVQLARDTTRSYLSYLDMVYLTERLPAWSSNRTSRLVKTPKLFVTDAGLAAHLLDVDADAIAEPGHPALGPLLETFVASELRKAIAYSDLRVRLFHLRTAEKQEIDFILEGPRGRVVAVEVKASTSVRANALSGMRWLRAQLGERLHAGVVLHLGREAASHGDGIYTLPLSMLWDHRPLP